MCLIFISSKFMFIMKSYLFQNKICLIKAIYLDLENILHNCIYSNVTTKGKKTEWPCIGNKKNKTEIYAPYCNTIR